MAVLPTPKNAISILKAFRDEIKNRTAINSFGADSKARILSDVLTDEILQAREEMTNAFFANQLSNATGEDLTAIGTGMGVPRLEQTFAEADEVESNIAFYVESGTFGAINSGADIVVPAGTTISSTPNNNELGLSINFILSKTYTLSASSTITFVTARAETSGAGHNIGAGVLRTHNFTNYADAANDSLKVINFFPILNGRNPETDAAYRFRLTQHYNRLIQNNNTRIQLTSLLIPGTVDTRIIPGYFGIGTVGVVVLGPENQSNDRLIASVQARLDSIKGPGLDIIAVPAVQVVVDLEIQLKTAASLNKREQNASTNAVKQTINQFFRSVSIGSSIDFDALAEHIRANIGTSVQLEPIGDRFKIFKSIFIRKGLSTTVPDERRQVITSLLPLEEDEYATLGDLTVRYL